MTAERVRIAEDLLSFVQLAPEAADETTLLRALMERTERWGVTHVAAGIMANRERTFKLGPRFGKINMAWATTYFDQQLYRSDPVMDYALRAERADYWDRTIDAKRLAKSEQKVLSYARDFGAADGYMAPVAIAGGDILIVSFQGERLERHPDVEAMLRGLAMVYGPEGQRLVTGSALKSGRFAGLTTRQLQVLHHAAMGKRNQDIANALGLSVKTVELHLAKARKHIGAVNTKEAVALIHATPRVTAPI